MSLDTFLVVDDSDDQRELLARHLRKAGRQVLESDNAEGGMALLAESGGDIGAVIIDLLMPGIDGWELAESVRSIAPDALLVIASVLDAHDYPAADAVLPKPFSGAQVLALIADLDGRA